MTSPSECLKGKLLFPFVAPPNAGKGTQTQILASRYQLPTFDMGATFRSILKEGTDPEMKALLESFMNNGKLVPVETVIAVFKKSFEQLAAKHPDVKGFILDGFPRSPEQANALWDLCDVWDAKIANVVYLKVGRDTVERRATGRRFCSHDTHHLYNIHNPQLTPQQKKIENNTVVLDEKGREVWLCDQDGADLIVRPDDEPEKVQVRLAEYARETDPLIDCFRSFNVLMEIDGEGSPESVTAAIDANIKPLLNLTATT